MSEFIYALRMLVVAAIIVVIMQVRVSGNSIEAHAENWIKTAAPVLVLRDVAEGGLLVLHDAWSSLMSNVNSKYSKKFDPETVPGKREMTLGLRRSEAYIDEETKKKEAAEMKIKARAQQVREALGLDGDSDSKTENQ